MSCVKYERLAKLYEQGEIDYFQKRSFENHVENCPVCKKKYKSMIILGALLYSSSKINKVDLVRNAATAIVAKVLIGFILLSGTAYVATTDWKSAEKRERATVKSYNENKKTQKINKIPVIVNTTTEEVKEKPVVSSGRNNTVKIRVKADSMEMNTEINGKTLKVEKRDE